MKSSLKSEPAGGEAGGLGVRRIGKQPSPDYTSGGGRLLRKWRAMMVAISDQELHGSELRVLAAVLDRMNGDWQCWPGYGRISDDTGLARRTATRAIDRLVKLGYLKKRARGTCRSNIYSPGHLLTCKSIDTQTDSDPQGKSIDTQTDNAIDPQVTPLSTHRSPEPGTLNPAQLNPKKEGGEGMRARDARPDAPPFDEIKKLYHEALPELPVVVKLTEAREEQIRKRWQNELKSLEKWREYFTWVRESDFLMGRGEPGSGYARPFIADFDFLLRQETVVGAAEGKYSERIRSGGRARNYL